MTYRELLRHSTARISVIYPDREASAIMRLVIETIKGWTSVDLMMHDGDEVSEYICEKVGNIVDRLLRHEPVQYILGEVYWHGMTLKVTPAVLIPRPETSQLVDIIAEENNGSDLWVLDLCTGSGAIAIALAKFLNFPIVTAIDISKDALDIAAENARSLKVSVKFGQSDILKPWGFRNDTFDILVSNPPYICEKEKIGMDRNVLAYEPSIALFVPDSDPLRFYRPLSREGYRVTANGGRIYLEINPDYADEIKALLETDGWRNVEIIKDMYGKDRFAKAVKPV